MKPQTAKGMRDFGHEEKILRDEVIKKLVEIFEKYGYSSLETPIVERYDVLSAKFGAGEGTEVMKEVFKLKDDPSSFEEIRKDTLGKQLSFSGRANNNQMFNRLEFMARSVSEVDPIVLTEQVK